MSAWARTAATTLRKYMKLEEDATLRNRELLRKLKAAGNIVYGIGGLDIQWQVKFQGFEGEDNTGENAITFSRKNRWKNAVLPNDRGFYVTDAIYTLEKKQNRGDEALVKVFEGMAKRLYADADDTFARQLYLDGNYTGNEHKLHGLDSVWGYEDDYTTATTQDSTQTGYVARTPAGTSDQADPLLALTATYAGLVTTPGNYGGAFRSASGMWPGGEADHAYDFWSPLYLNYRSTFWEGTTDSYEDNCVECFRWSNIHSHRNTASTGGMDMILLDRDLLYRLMNRQDAKERVIVQQAMGNPRYGFDSGKNARMFLDGIEITTDYGVPVGVGYGFNTSQIELWSMGDGVLFEAVNDSEIEAQADRFVVSFLGNMKFKDIRTMTKYVNGDNS